MWTVSFVVRDAKRTSAKSASSLAQTIVAIADFHVLGLYFARIQKSEAVNKSCMAILLVRV